MRLIKIDYKAEEDYNTFELFDSIEKAFRFTKLVKVLEISLVEVNEDNIYYEENGDLNYEDNSNLFL